LKHPEISLQLSATASRVSDNRAGTDSAVVTLCPSHAVQVETLIPSVSWKADPMASPAMAVDHDSPRSFERPIDVKAAAQFLGVSPSLVYAYVERKQIPHFRMMDRWRQQFHVNGGING
jgi:predicted DNA-binding transcriptional regulator AlpA